MLIAIQVKSFLKLVQQGIAVLWQRPEGKTLTVTPQQRILGGCLQSGGFSRPDPYNIYARFCAEPYFKALCFVSI